MNICFGDLVKVNGWWEVAFKSNGEVVTVLTPPHPRMDGSGLPGFRAVGIDRVEGHIGMAAVSGAIEALEKLVYLKSIKETNRAEHDANKEEAWKQAQAALRAVRGEETK